MKIIWTNTDCKEAEETLMEASLISSDIETIPYEKKRQKKYPGYPFLMTVSAYSCYDSNGDMRSFVFPFVKGKSPQSGAPTALESIYRTCARINASGIPFTGQNYSYDCTWFLRYGMPVANYALDSMTMWWAKFPELPRKLDFISSILLDDYQYWKAGRKSEDFVEYCEYAATDTESTLRNTLILLDEMLEDERMRRNFWHAHMRCLIGLGMSAKGMRADPEVMEGFRTDLTKTASEKLERLRYLVADPDFNPQSPQQKARLIYELLGARKRNAKGKFIKKGTGSTGAMPLRAMRGEHPIFRRVGNAILEALEPAKQLSNVVGLHQLPHLPNSPRFLTFYDGVGTTTTRFSSKSSALGDWGGNAQNIRKDYRRFLAADAESFLLDVDYSGADDVHIGYESEDTRKIELIESGKDIHAFNAATIFFTNWQYDQIVDAKKDKNHPDYMRVVHPITGIRQITKKLGHGIHYLMAGLTLLMTAQREAIVAAAKELGYEDAGFWSQEKLADFCTFLEGKYRAYYTRFKRQGPDSFYTDLREEVARTKGFTTIYNYYQRFLGDPRDEEVLRAVAATSGQANTGGRVNMAMEELVFGIRTFRFRDGPAPDADDPALSVSESEHGISLRLQTHDSLTFNVRYTHPNWREGIRRVYHVLNRPVVCKGRIFRVRTEGEVSLFVAGKETKGADSLEEIESFVRENFAAKGAKVA